MDVSVRALTKRFGAVDAVRDLSFEVPAGRVTGFLGPNGAGKTTTLRVLLGLVRPSAGEALVGGRRYVDLPAPRRAVGAVLEAGGFHPGRTARAHLRVLATAAGLPHARVGEVLDLVGLAGHADRAVGGYSLGMRQRLGLAGALLGDPRVLILDEPANGLDPEGIAWLRRLLRDLAGEGRTVLISSHVLAEVAQTADHVVIISDGRSRFAGPLGDLGAGVVSVRTPHADRLRAALAARGHWVAVAGPSALDVRGASADEIGRIAAEEQIPLSALTDGGASLEAAFLRLTGPADPADEPAPAGAR
jgi:ABC-2 type transport system ATP-binding protein